LYAACADRCHHYLTVLLGSRHAADDVLQETFVRLARMARKLANIDNLSAYVFTVARREAARHAGRQAREARHRVAPAAEDLFLEARYDEAAARESAEAVAAVLCRLSDEQREVVELKVYGGLTFREIAAVTGVPLPTAATRYRAALERLKEWFARQPL